MTDIASPQPTRRDFLYIATETVGVVSAAAASIPFISQMNPDAATLAAGGPVDVDISKIAPGQQISVRWRERPIFLINRSPKALKSLQDSQLVDQLAERIQTLGGLSYAMAADVAENTNIPRPPKGREEVPVQISRLLTAHEIILQGARSSARKAAEMGDDGTNDVLVSNVIRTNEMQVWFLAEHLV